ncbi:BTB/POZ domain-containing protein [Camellia lanceoleosa]|uniref:BTB/POZ domain-containing protein n=1 Tax=Camellia lanceoleosa TaxID=1840588 RepID=A0ACC0FAM5_9ERIC|nr:BTB/POZ domain-containing protein [Camellia lanceoleosa]
MSFDLFDPRTVMDSDYSSNGSRDSNFGFAFNNSNFSDRVLRVEIMADLPKTQLDGEGCHSLADWARHRKRRREDVKKDNVWLVRKSGDSSD